MIARTLRASLLVASMLAGAPAHAEEGLVVGGTRLTPGMSRGAARAALKADPNLLVTRLGDTELAVTDTRAMRAVAVLTFDGQGTLRRILKNRTPQANGAVPLALALHEVAAELSGPGSDGRPCSLSAPRRSPVGPNAWLRHPGEPDLEIREVLIVCGDRAILLHLRQPSETTKGAEVLQIEKVLLYEVMADAPGSLEQDAGGPRPRAK